MNFSSYFAQRFCQLKWRYADEVDHSKCLVINDCIFFNYAEQLMSWESFSRVDPEIFLHEARRWSASLSNPKYAAKRYLHGAILCIYDVMHEILSKFLRSIK